MSIHDEIAAINEAIRIQRETVEMLEAQVARAEERFWDLAQRRFDLLARERAEFDQQVAAQ